MTDLITGGTGFVGGRLLAEFARLGRRPRVLIRDSAATAVRAPTSLPASVEMMADPYVGALEDSATLRRACAGCEVVYHCAGFAHADQTPENAARHHAVNFLGARAMAAAAAAAGARRFVFLSSVKAMGPTGDAIADENWPTPPDNDYGRAKRQAETAISQICAEADVECVLLRLTMVYGAAGRGNLRKMASLIARGLFPPPPETGNRRSMVHVDDVVAALQLAGSHPQAPGEAMIIAHPDAHSGREIYDSIRHALGLRRLRLATPALALGAAARLGDAVERVARRRTPINSAALERLLGSAWYSPELARKRLGWRARIDLAAGLAEMLGPQWRTAA